MNQAKIWLVVNPSHGLPLLWGAVLGIALLVHFMVLTHTTWFSAYWQGKAKASPVAMVADAPR
jgi:light-harvesting protein B-800-850 alpha chain